MNAQGKDGKNPMKTIPVTTVVRVKEKPKVDALAAELLARCRQFYEDPENERAFEEWKAGKGAGK